MRGIKYFFTICISIFSVFAFGQTQDTLRIKVAEYPAGVMEDLSSNPDLSYTIDPKEKVGIITRILSWIGELLGKLLDVLGAVPENLQLIENIIYIVSAIIIGILLYKLFGYRYTGVFGSKKNAKSLDYESEPENIHEIDFEQAISDALKQSQFQLAIRLVYLSALKFLSDENIIQWVEGKTNEEYIYEIEDLTKRSYFERLSNRFMYVWYGHFETNQHSFEQANRELQEIKK